MYIYIYIHGYMIWGEEVDAQGGSVDRTQKKEWAEKKITGVGWGWTGMD